MNALKMATGVAMLVLASTATVWAQINLRPGNYEVTGEMSLGGIPMKPQKDFDCVTAEHVKDLSAFMQRDESTKGCKVSDVKTTGTRMIFNTTCEEDGTRYTSTSEMTFGGDSYAGTMKMDSGGRVTLIKMSGKRVGECTK